ncbi:hypothetical protein D3C71_1821410 [compost metagenome]
MTNPASTIARIKPMPRERAAADESYAAIITPLIRQMMPMMAHIPKPGTNISITSRTIPMINSTTSSTPAKPATYWPKKYSTKLAAPMKPGMPKPGTNSSMAIPASPRINRTVVTTGLSRKRAKSSEKEGLNTST